MANARVRAAKKAAKFAGKIVDAPVTKSVAQEAAETVVAETAAAAETVASTTAAEAVTESVSVSMDQAIAKKALGKVSKVDRYHVERINSQFQPDFEELASGGNAAGEVAKRRGINLEKVNPEQHQSHVEAELRAQRKASIKDPTARMWSGALYYKAPQAAGGLLATAWLVNNLSGRKGQQSNAELYNQR